MKAGRHHNQRIGRWEIGQDLDYLRHKAERASIVCSIGDERGTSSRCPQCGHRHRPKGRDWQCKKCGFTGHRDVVGAVNMHVNGFGRKVTFPARVTYRRAGPMRAARQGTLVGIASVAAIRGLPGHGAYCASKAAVVAYCESLRGECRPFGVRVVTLLPGYIATPLTARNPYPMPFLMAPEAFTDKAFRAMVGRLFPDKKLEPIPLDDDLYSAEVNGTAVTTVRCRTDAAGGAGAAGFREVAPQLEGIKLDGRWVVVYSKYDIGCALEKHQSSDCLGHDFASAVKLGTAVVLYALKR